MATNSEVDASEGAETPNYGEVLVGLTNAVEDLRIYKDTFFENHSQEFDKGKDNLIKGKKEEILKKFEAIDEATIPPEERAQFLLLKGRCYNINSIHDHRALECLSKAVKLDPNLVQAWNELGECYWKNLNLKEARICFEGALIQKRDRVTLRSLSVLYRQEKAPTQQETYKNVLKSVEYAKKAVALDPKDGQSWSILGNAYLCQFFLGAQLSVTLRLALGAYKQAWQDPIARGHPDLHYNKGIALKYEERYNEAIESFLNAIRLDPPWSPPIDELKALVGFLNYVNDLLKFKGKLKGKRIVQMVKSMEESMFGEYRPGSIVTLNKKKVSLQHTKLSDLVEGENPGTVVLGRVVGSLHTNNAVPFTFGIVDESMTCIGVNVYNWADGRGVIIGDCVAIPEPAVTTHDHTTDYPEVINKDDAPGSNNLKNKNKKKNLSYNFRTIRVNDPRMLRVNGNRVNQNEFASTRVTSTYEAH